MPAGATYEPIATTTLGSAQANITFSSISGSYTDLRLIVVTAPSSATLQYFDIELNGDTATNYSLIRLYGDGSTAGSVAQANVNKARAGIVGASSSLPSLIITDIFSYAGSTNKTLLTQSSADMNGSGQVNRIVNLWRSTSAITSIKIFMDGGGNMISGTTATLYGIKAA